MQKSVGLPEPFFNKRKWQNGGSQFFKCCEWFNLAACQSACEIINEKQTDPFLCSLRYHTHDTGKLHVLNSIKKSNDNPNIQMEPSQQNQHTVPVKFNSKCIWQSFLLNALEWYLKIPSCMKIHSRKHISNVQKEIKSLNWYFTLFKAMIHLLLNVNL